MLAAQTTVTQGTVPMPHTLSFVQAEHQTYFLVLPWVFYLCILFLLPKHATLSSPSPPAARWKPLIQVIQILARTQVFLAAELYQFGSNFSLCIVFLEVIQMKGSSYTLKIYADQ